jgi:transposase
VLLDGWLSDRCLKSYVGFGSRRWLVGSFIGIDTHKDTITVTAVNEVGRAVATATAVNDGRGFRKVEGLAHRVGAVRVGVEASRSYGLALAHRLLGAGFDVREVPAQLTRRERRSAAKGKSDAIDSLLIARVVAKKDDLPPPPRQGLAHDLKALVDHRETLLDEATRHRNRAHALLVQIRPGYQRVVPKLDSKPKTQAARRLIGVDTSVRAQLVRDALDRVDELESTAARLEKEIDVLVKASGTTLTTWWESPRSTRRRSWERWRTSLVSPGRQRSEPSQAPRPCQPPQEGLIGGVSTVGATGS